MKMGWQLAQELMKEEDWVLEKLAALTSLTHTGPKEAKSTMLQLKKDKEASRTISSAIFAKNLVTSLRTASLELIE